MADQIFDQVRTHLAVALDFDWMAGNVSGLLVDSGAGALWTPDPTDQFVGSILGAGAVEAATAGDRPTLSGLTAALSGSDHVVYYDSDPVIYGGVGLGVTFDTFVLFEFVSDDTDSWLIGAYDLGAQTGDGTNVTVNPNTKGWLYW